MDLFLFLEKSCVDRFLPIPGGGAVWICSCSLKHSWAQQKLSLLTPLNILLSINGLLLSFRVNGLHN